jgi:hypothetical protein
MDTTRVKFDHKDRVVGHQPAHRPDLGGEEICGEERVPVGAQERAPRHRPSARRRNALFLEDLRDRRSGNPMVEILERALNPCVAPSWIVSRHSDHKAADFDLHAGSPRSRRRIRPLARDQFAVPPENRVRRDDRRDVGKDSPSEALTDDGETPTFIVIQPQPPALQLRLQYTVLFPQKFNDIALLLLKPAKQRGDNQLQRRHPRSLRQTVVGAVFVHYGRSGAKRLLRYGLTANDKNV